MNLTELKNLLEQYPSRRINFLLPDMTTMPVHFHITEVGHVQKNYIDCGGTSRTSSLRQPRRRFGGCNTKARMTG